MINIVNKPFNEVLANMRSRISQAGFLVIHEINTREILANHGYEISELRQLLFFHPQYMKTILEEDASSVIKVPLKIVVRELTDSSTEITYSNASELFSGSPSLNIMATTLDEKIAAIVNVQQLLY